MTRETIPGRLVIIAAVACAASLAAVPRALAGDAVHYQGGVAHEVVVDANHVMVVTDGSATAVDLALLLAGQGLGTSFSTVGDTSITYDVQVGAVTDRILTDLTNQPGIVSAYPILRFREGGQAFGITGEVVVKFSEGTTITQRRVFEADYALQLQINATQDLGLDQISVYKALDGDPLGIVSAMQSDGRLADWRAQAELISPVDLRQSSPQDEHFSLQWHLSNNGNFPGSVNADIDVLTAWETTKGEGVRVGMHDDGCEVLHQDLSPNYLGFSEAAGGGAIPLGGGHGTAVMGLIVADDNQIGVVGVAPDAEFTATGGLGGVSPARLAAAYTFAVRNDVEVHNNSWGFPAGNVPDVIVEAVQDAANTGRDGKGIVFVWAAGNSFREMEPGDDLSTLPEVIQVGATGQTDVIASYSNYGVTQDIMGPTQGDDGVGLATTDTTGSGGFNDGNSPIDILGAPNYTRRMGGTSGASPVVAGVATLVVAVNPNLNRAQVRSLLIHTTDRVSPLDADYGDTTRFSLRYGFGRVNAAKAVEAATASLGDNATWPGRGQEINILVFEGEEDLLTNISWLPSGMVLGGQGDEIASDEEEVVIFYRVPAQEGPDDIEFTPVDGVEYVPCDPNDFDTCILPAPFSSPNLVVIYSGLPNGEPTGDGQRRLIENLPLAGNDPDDAQLFAMYARSSNGLYSFARVFDQNGDDTDEGGDDGGGIIVPPPDQGRPIDPELVPDQPGLNDPPSVTATADRTVCGAPCDVEFHGGVFTSNDIVDRGWSFGDGVSSSQDSITHTYELPGTYNAVYFAMDDDEPNGRISTKLIQIDVGSDAGGVPQPGFQTAEIQVLTPRPIIAPNAQVRLSVQTTGIGESQNSVRVTYDWDFGDGNMGGGQTAENIYANPGFYSVIVLITEDLANGQRMQLTASTIVEIEGVPTPSTQSIPLDQTQGTGDSSATGADACGIMGAASLTLTLLGLCGIRFRRRRAC